MVLYSLFLSSCIHCAHAPFSRNGSPSCAIKPEWLAKAHWTCQFLFDIILCAIFIIFCLFVLCNLNTRYYLIVLYVSHLQCFYSRKKLWRFLNLRNIQWRSFFSCYFHIVYVNDSRWLRYFYIVIIFFLYFIHSCFVHVVGVILTFYYNIWF